MPGKATDTTPAANQNEDRSGPNEGEGNQTGARRYDAETRAFVAHALVYSWIYAARMHLPAASLDDLAAGEFPRFTPLEREGTMAVVTNAGLH